MAETNQPLTLTMIAEALNTWGAEHDAAEDWSSVLVRVLTAAHIRPEAPLPEAALRALAGWSCDILGHEWVSVDPAQEVPYCLWCEAEQSVPDSASMDPVLILLASAANDTGSGAFEAAVIEDGQVRRVHDIKTGPTTTFALLLEGLIAALDTVPTGVPVTIWSPSQSLVNPLQRNTVTQWASRGWRTGRGEPVAHAAAWQALLAHLQQHPYTIERVAPDQSAHMARAVQRVHETVSTTFAVGVAS